MIIENIVFVRYTICYLGSNMIMGAYCVGKVHIMLPQEYYEIGAYCVGKAHNMLPQ